MTVPLVHARPDDVVDTVPPGASPARRQAFGVVLAIEFWERFGFYGMQAILLLYLVQHLHMDEHTGNLMLGAFGMAVYVMPAIGGMVGDRFLGARRAVSCGAATMAVGYAALGASVQAASLLFPALALIAVGNGLFKPNAGNLVRAIFDRDDAGLDAAFTLYYMAVNVGAAISMLLTPWLQDHYGAPTAFYACALGLAVGLLYATIRRRLLDMATNSADQRHVPASRMGTMAAGFLLLVVLVAVVLAVPTLSAGCVVLAAIGLTGGWIALHRVAQATERAGLLLAYILSVQSALYFLFYQQMMTSLTLFALHAVDGTFRIGGHVLFSMSAAQFESFNSFWIMGASPILAVLYAWAGRQGRDLSLAVKVSIGFALVAAAFAVWWQAALHAPDHGAGRVSPWSMVVGYGFLSIGELLIGGLGLAVIARYVPERFSGFMMGALYLLWGLAMYVGSMMANEAASSPASRSAETAATFVPLFFHLFVIALVIAAVVGALLPVCKRLDHLHGSVIDHL